MTAYIRPWAVLVRGWLRGRSDLVLGLASLLTDGLSMASTVISATRRPHPRAAGSASCACSDRELLIWVLVEELDRIEAGATLVGFLRREPTCCLPSPRVVVRVEDSLPAGPSPAGTAQPPQHGAAR